MIKNKTVFETGDVVLNLPVLTFEQYILFHVTQSKVEQVVKKYTDSSDSSDYEFPTKGKVPTELVGPTTEDKPYDRNCVKLLPGDIDTLKSQLLEQMVNYGVRSQEEFGEYGFQKTNYITTEKLDFQSIEGGIQCIVENFGVPTHLVQLSPKTYLVIDGSPDTIELKFLPPNLAGLVLYRPNRVCTISVVEREGE